MASRVRLQNIDRELQRCMSELGNHGVNSKQRLRDAELYALEAVSYTHLTLPTKRIV